MRGNFGSALAALLAAAIVVRRGLRQTGWLTLFKLLAVSVPAGVGRKRGARRGTG